MGRGRGEEGERKGRGKGEREGGEGGGREGGEGEEEGKGREVDGKEIKNKV